MTEIVSPDTLRLEKLVYKYAYACVDSWDLDNLIEFAERKVIEEGLKRIQEDPEGLIDEMTDYWNVDSLDEVNPDDFNA